MNVRVRQYIQSKISGFCKRHSKMMDYESETQSMEASMAISISKPLSAYHSSESQQHGQKLIDIQSRISISFKQIENIIFHITVLLKVFHC